MTRQVLVATIAFVLVASATLGIYSKFFRGTPSPDAPVFNDNPAAPLAKEDEFEKLAREDPVAMLSQCLSRYTREVKGGLHATLEKQERVKGEPKHPKMPDVEIIDLWVRGDVPDAETKKTSIEVLMKWKQGARRPLGLAEVRGTLFSEKPTKEGGLDGKMRTWRPEATFGSLSSPVAPNNDLTKRESRYCIRDAGVYRSMLRTHEAWKARLATGELKIEYLGKKTHEKIGRECHVIKRICPRTEIDAFEIGGTANTDPDVVEKEGFTEVTIYIDTERWLQVGSELHRTEPDGTRVLVGAYYFRDVELNPSMPSDTFTVEGLKR